MAQRKGEYLIPSGSREGACRSCGAAVIWVTTAKGSAMPLSVATIEERDGERYAISHFSDCPQAKGWSKKPRSRTQEESEQQPDDQPPPLGIGHLV